LDSSSWQLPAVSFFARTGDIFSIVEVDIGQIPNGVYWVAITTNDGLLTKQFLVLR
jgi:hypothetical protein